jgi:hypothetical protein
MENREPCEEFKAVKNLPASSARAAAQPKVAGLSDDDDNDDDSLNDDVTAAYEKFIAQKLREATVYETSFGKIVIHDDQNVCCALIQPESAIGLKMAPRILMITPSLVKKIRRHCKSSKVMTNTKGYGLLDVSHLSGLIVAIVKNIVTNIKEVTILKKNVIKLQKNDVIRVLFMQPEPDSYVDNIIGVISIGIECDKERFDMFPDVWRCAPGIGMIMKMHIRADDRHDQVISIDTDISTDLLLKFHGNVFSALKRSTEILSETMGKVDNMKLRLDHAMKTDKKHVMSMLISHINKKNPMNGVATCSHCNTPGLICDYKYCSKCYGSMYCDKKCMRKDLKTHKRLCDGFRFILLM